MNDKPKAALSIKADIPKTEKEASARMEAIGQLIENAVKASPFAISFVMSCELEEGSVAVHEARCASNKLGVGLKQMIRQGQVLAMQSAEHFNMLAEIIGKAEFQTENEE